MSSLRNCEICKQPIEPDRATDYPSTTLCAAHGEAIMKYGGEFHVTGSQELISKPGTMKKNFGGVATAQTRNYAGLRRLRDDFLEQS